MSNEEKIVNAIQEEAVAPQTNAKDDVSETEEFSYKASDAKDGEEQGDSSQKPATSDDDTSSTPKKL